MQLLAYTLLFYIVIGIITTEPCNDYDDFTADSEREPSHTESVYANKICDAILSTKWYRLVGDAGSDLTNDSSVLVDDGCGTSYQLWMNGTIPEVSEGAVDRQICMRTIFSICHSSFTIKVKNCCSYQVYQLKSATNCPQAYCVSNSLVSPFTCTLFTTTTSATTTTTVTTTTTTTTPVGVAPTTVKPGSGNTNVTVVDSIDSKVIIVILVLLLIIAFAVIGIFIVVSCKSKNFNRKVNQQPQSADTKRDIFNEPVVNGVPPPYTVLQNSVGGMPPTTSKMDITRTVRENSILLDVPGHSDNMALLTDHQQTTYCNTPGQVDTSEHCPPQSTSGKAQLENRIEKVANSENSTTTPKNSASGTVQLENKIEKEVATPKNSFTTPPEAAEVDKQKHFPSDSNVTTVLGNGVTPNSTKDMTPKDTTFSSYLGQIPPVYVVSFVCEVQEHKSNIAEPCVTYTNFTADSERSPNHTESVYVNKVCDAVLSTKWYRLVGDAGSDLTNDSSVLLDDGCGTSYQRWMNGTIPEVSEGAVDRQICMRSIFSICHSSFNIKVKNCCSFRVYQLKSATNCPQAYCVSPSLVPSDNCSHIVWTTTTVTTTSTTTTTRPTTTSIPATTTNTTGVTNVLDDNGKKGISRIQRNKDVTVVDSIDSKVIVIVVLLSVIAVVVIGILVAVSLRDNSNVNHGPPNQTNQTSGQTDEPHSVKHHKPIENGSPPASAEIPKTDVEIGRPPASVGIPNSVGENVGSPAYAEISNSDGENGRPPAYAEISNSVGENGRLPASADIHNSGVANGMAMSKMDITRIVRLTIRENSIYLHVDDHSNNMTMQTDYPQTTYCTLGQVDTSEHFYDTTTETPPQSTSGKAQLENKIEKEVTNSKNSTTTPKDSANGTTTLENKLEKEVTNSKDSTTTPKDSANGTTTLENKLEKEDTKISTTTLSKAAEVDYQEHFPFDSIATTVLGNGVTPDSTKYMIPKDSTSKSKDFPNILTELFLDLLLRRNLSKGNNTLCEMKQKVMKLVVFASIVCIIDKAAGEPCVTYTNFTADSERSPNHTESVYENKVCDAVLSTKWYRLVGNAGSDLTNDSSVLIDDGCGTSYQRWMNGTIPDVSEGEVDRQICMRSIFSICHSSFTIKVKNCCSFRVYQLKSATNCPQAYCVSPSLVPSDNCSHIVWTTTTVTTTSTTSTTTTTTTTTTTSTTTTTTPATTGVMNVLHDNENKTNVIPLIVIVAGLVAIIMVAVLGIWLLLRKGILSKKDTCNVKIMSETLQGHLRTCQVCWWRNAGVPGEKPPACGTVPGVSELAVDRDVCMRSIFSICHNKFTIKVKDCCSFRVYQLKSATNCPPAYCGSKYFLLWRDTAKWTKYVVNRITVKPKPEVNNRPPFVHEAFESNEHVDPKREKHKSPALLIDEIKSNSNESVKPKPGELKSPSSVIEAIKSNSPVKLKPEKHNYPPVVTEAFTSNEHVKPKRGTSKKQLMMMHTVKSCKPVNLKPGENKSLPVVMEASKCDESVINGVAPNGERPVIVIQNQFNIIATLVNVNHCTHF
ncbi:uncharacterized protein [Argopecten irradians]|uniref:uncharacterized protein n=1 Tax=Argopecten irradians TaxID=31199 RepID=UPI003720FF03